MSRISLIALALVLAVSCLAPASATADNYLVRGTFIDPGVMGSPQMMIPVFENVVFPSLAMLAEWEKNGTIRGGVTVGAKEGYFIVNATSNAELDQMLQSLPFWGLLEWEVMPLHSFGARLDTEKTMIARMKEQAAKNAKK